MRQRMTVMTFALAVLLVIVGTAFAVGGGRRRRPPSTVRAVTASAEAPPGRWTWAVRMPMTAEAFVDRSAAEEDPRSSGFLPMRPSPVRFGSYAPENFDMTLQATVPVRGLAICSMFLQSNCLTASAPAACRRD